MTALPFAQEMTAGEITYLVVVHQGVRHIVIVADGERVRCIYGMAWTITAPNLLYPVAAISTVITLGINTIAIIKPIHIAIITTKNKPSLTAKPTVNT